MKIIYLYKNEGSIFAERIRNILIKELTNDHDITPCDTIEHSFTLIDLIEKNTISPDLIILQNSNTFFDYHLILKRLKNLPRVFVSYDLSIHSYTGLQNNLFEVFNFGNARLENWGIPNKMQTALFSPVKKRKNQYHEKKESEDWQIVYYPTSHTIQNADSAVFSLVSQREDFFLTIISDNYNVLRSSLPSRIKVIPQKDYLLALKRAHFVLASEYDILEAMSYGKSCIIIGDYGIGGLVTPDNYEVLKNNNFRGRTGASFNEYIPPELLMIEIMKSLKSFNKEKSTWIQKQIIKDFSYSVFNNTVNQRLNTVFSISQKLKDKKMMMALKPCITDYLEVRELEGKVYLMYRTSCFCEIDKIFQAVLMLCNGDQTIRDITLANKYTKGEISVLCANLLELWKKKMILFHE